MIEQMINQGNAYGARDLKIKKLAELISISVDFAKHGKTPALSSYLEEQKAVNMYGYPDYMAKEGFRNTRKVY